MSDFDEVDEFDKSLLSYTFEAGKETRIKSYKALHNVNGSLTGMFWESNITVKPIMTISAPHGKMALFEQSRINVDSACEAIRNFMAEHTNKIMEENGEES